MPCRRFTDITTVKMLLARVGTALVILFVFVDLSEQSVCNVLPPINDVRQELSRSEQRLVNADLADNIETWKSPGRGPRPNLTFVMHENRNKRYLTASKKDTKVVAREKRSVRPCRKEYRQMSRGEMRRFHRALQLLKASGVYDDLVNFHTRIFAPAAHNGAAFLPWHREFLYQLEQAMRALGDNFRRVTVPFWDSCMDSTLPVPRDSVVWTNQFWGPSNGPVTSGRLAPNWAATDACRSIGLLLTRSTGSGSNRLLTRDKFSNDMLPSLTFTELTLESPLEGFHGSNHVYVGGHLRSIRCSPNDPIFFLLHGMFDCIWEEWSELPGKINTYPVPGVPPGLTVDDIGGSIHLGSAPMDPFPLQNIDGLTWDGYTCCAQRPSAIQCGNDADCKSPQGLLFCNQCLCHSKIQRGGDCSGFPHKACYCRNRRRTPNCHPVQQTCRCV